MKTELLSNQAEPLLPIVNLANTMETNQSPQPLPGPTDPLPKPTSPSPGPPEPKLPNQILPCT